MANVLARKTIQHARGVPSLANITVTRHIQLNNVPRTALPTDIWRLCSKAKIDHIDSVDIDYNRLAPNGNAWITLTDDSHAEYVLKKFKNGLYIGASRVEALTDARNSVNFARRRRGEKGRADAAARGVLGKGPSGGIATGANSVCLSGFPDYTKPEFVKAFLKSFKLTTSGEQEIVKLDTLTKDPFNTCSRFLVRLSSASEAHRLVRKLHETDFEETNKNKTWRLKARVIY